MAVEDRPGRFGFWVNSRFGRASPKEVMGQEASGAQVLKEQTAEMQLPRRALPCAYLDMR